MRILDSHHHLWDPAVRVYPWMTPAVAAICRRFDVEDLRAAAPACVTQTIVVQAAHAIDETEELLRTAAADEFVIGVVGWVDLTLPDVTETLARLREGPGGIRLCGIRHQIENEPDRGWMLRDDVAGGLHAVAAANLCYDLLVPTRELPAATRLAGCNPELRLILDHAAKPNIAERAWEPWSTHMAAIAKMPNVVCKLSGLITEANHQRWSSRDVAPYIQRILELFGTRRVLFGSDWPVCLLAGSYTDVLDMVLEELAALSAGERADVFGGNARRVYLEGTA